MDLYNLLIPFSNIKKKKKELFSEIYSPQSIWIIGVIGIHFPETVFDFLFQVVKLKHQEINFLSAITNQDGVFVPPTPQLLNIELTIQILEFLIEKSPKQISFSSVRILINLLENFNCNFSSFLFFFLNN